MAFVSFERWPLPLDSSHRNAIDRYYIKFFALDVGGKSGEDQYVYRHFNKLLVIGVAPTHPLISKQTIKRVNFDVGTRNRLTNQVKGKQKKGGIHLNPEDELCEVFCGDGAKYVLRSCVRGFLIEINESLLKNPSLLQEKPLSDGFIAIVSQPAKDRIDLCLKSVALEVKGNDENGIFFRNDRTDSSSNEANYDSSADREIRLEKSYHSKSKENTGEDQMPLVSLSTYRSLRKDYFLSRYSSINEGPTTVSISIGNEDNNSQYKDDSERMIDETKSTFDCSAHCHDLLPIPTESVQNEFINTASNAKLNSIKIARDAKTTPRTIDTISSDSNLEPTINRPKSKKKKRMK